MAILDGTCTDVAISGRFLDGILRVIVRSLEEVWIVRSKREWAWVVTGHLI